MCGIVGIVRFARQLPEPSALELAIGTLANRGPDSRGTWRGPGVMLGHTRLAIVDLTAAGHQPMLSGDGRFVIVFNGEIYNHADIRRDLGSDVAWRSSSDTETLLEAYRRWGAGCLARLEGMFAFAIWDNLERRLFLARDRIGEKPLYFAKLADGIAFASRPSALRALLGSDVANLDANALAAYVDLGYVPSPLCIWSGLSKLPPAHYLEVSQDDHRTVRYWDFRCIKPDAGLAARPEPELLDELDELLRRAVRQRLLSDVPLGAFLSGGTDSSLVLSIMRSVSATRPVAFTIGFKEPAYDESAEARMIAGHLDVDHRVEMLGVSSLLDLLPECVDAFDEPIADSSAFPTMAVARLARPFVTVALTGDAGDELFGGYHYYAIADRMARLVNLPRSVRRRAATMLDLLPSHRTKLLAEAMRRNSDVSRYHFIRSMRKDFPSVLLAGPGRDIVPSSWLFEAAACSFALDLTPSEIGMRLDTTYTLADGFLQKVDVATMASSLESRCVLTDHHIVEWSMRLPMQFKRQGGRNKYLLKKLLERHLPKEVVHRPKRGFGMPVAAWLRGRLRPWAEAIINEDALFTGTPIDQTAVRALFALHSRGSRDVHPLLWSTLMLLCFIARHQRGIELPPVQALPRAA